MDRLKRAHSILKIKSIDENQEERIIEGVATTMAVDSYGDTVDPMGAEFELPMPLLWQHRHDQPVGHVEFAKPTKEGIPFIARIFKTDEQGTLKDRLDEAWQSVKLKLVQAVSIGFQPKEWDENKEGGYNFKKWKWVELSLVTIPANTEATISVVRSADRDTLAAIGRKKEDPVVVKLAGASVSTPNSENKGKNPMLTKQLEAAEAKRAANAARLEAILKSAHEDGERTLDNEEAEEFDNLEAEIEALDAQIRRLNVALKSAMDNAKPVEGSGAEKAAASRGAPAVVSSTKNDEPGLTFARYAMSVYAGRGNLSVAKEFAEHTFGKDQRLNAIMKAAVAAGTTTNPEWAGNLIEAQNASQEFLDFLRPRTILGQFGQNGVPALRQVPFNIRIPGKTSAGTAQWVGEGYRKPVTASGYEATELKWAKIAAISVITEELARFSDPSIQILVRDDLSEAVIERMDVDFVDPAKSVGTGSNASPASITNGVTPIPATGNPHADIAALWATADATNLPVSSAFYLTSTSVARQLSGYRNALTGAREFPEMSVSGGSIDGIRVIVSNYVPAGLFILGFASEIYLADDGVVTIDTSREATIVMDDDATATPTLAQIQSMFQTNQLAIRAERYVNWQKRRPEAVSYLSGVNWAPVVDNGGGDGGDGD